MDEKLKVGDHVIWVDPVGRQFNALVTAVWSQTCINVVFVSNDESKTDSYGRQIERETSVCNRLSTTVHGRYFMMPGDTPNPIVQPEQK